MPSGFFYVCLEMGSRVFGNFVNPCYFFSMLKATEAAEVMSAEKVTHADLTDTQSERDYRAIPIQKVGVRDVKFPICFRDRAGASQSTVATVGLFVNLPKEVKGTHMSRFLEVLHEHGRELDISGLPRLVREVRMRLASDEAQLEIRFPFFRSKKAPVTQRQGTLNYTGSFSVSLRGDDVDLVEGVTVPVTTLCPCSKTISLYGAHNQRSYVHLRVRADPPLWLEELVEIAEASGSSELYSLLKREDEKALTERAYENPVFVEDLARNVAQRLNTCRAVAWYRIEAENLESIHQHNAYACIESP